jgi:hypothetical protein
VTASGTDLLVVLEVPQVPAERVAAATQGS